MFSKYLNVSTRIHKTQTGFSLSRISTTPKFYSNYSEYYISVMYDTWKNNPNSVHPYWDNYFRVGNVRGGGGSSEATATTYVQPSSSTGVSSTCEHTANIEDNQLTANIIESYQNRGHYFAEIDPLNITRGPLIKKERKNENPVFKQLRMPQNLTANYCLPDSTLIGFGQKVLPFQDILKRLENIYSRSIGVELTHMYSTEKIMFVRQMMEAPQVPPPMPKELKVHVLSDLLKAGAFEFFLSKKWPSEKRFGIEGGDSFIPAINHVIECGSDLGANSFVLGMAHRGRLNTLTNVLKRKPRDLFATFRPLEPSDQYGVGDVKYHFGTFNVIPHPRTKKPMKLSLVSNPSHLESVNTVVLGKVAAEQIFDEKGDHTKVWPLVIHGDAAVCGQGVVYESIHLCELTNYTIGGSIHIVINNQIGFTTDPKRSRSSEYPTGVLKMVEAPIFHVNGDDVDAVIHCCRMAAEYKAKFHNDVVIDIVGYRRHGHNEADQPSFTQPLMYKKINSLKHTQDIYAEQLISEKVLTKEEVEKIKKDYNAELEEEFKLASKKGNVNTELWIDSPWKGFFKGKDPLMVPLTGVPLDVLKKIGKHISTPPPSFNLHKALVRIFKNRDKLLSQGKVDWACGESFAYATLLKEGIFVRLSGQDVERGTFSHRHHYLHDQTPYSYKGLNILENIFPNQAKYSLSNSSLSEYGILGFELGMSLVNPHTLIMWEAQFGDFVNSAQIIIDQYLSSGEGKWIRQSGIVLLLPHGMEGMGPEHSSARMERFLQMCNDDDGEVTLNMPLQMKLANWFIVNPSTPANFFHVIRRQVKLNYRKPLILFTPKALLRLPACVSDINDFVDKTKFKPYIRDPEVPASDKVVKLLLCSGKVYYELREERKLKNLKEKIAIGRVEQLFPLPYEELINDALKNFPKSRVFWVQEEHKNQGGWTFVAPRLNKALGNEKGPVNYIGRPPSCSAAAGLKSVHIKERTQFLNDAMMV